ncbi:hypothetical protein FRB94_005803 [Tulasnella sp. JGI-2019a]|nr:hypothetical protein FRB94_005803 [Tulasnella sp. JGI-2019a]KAG9036626.1 hypothetical protein FRB95_008460 [Tulasnella sp. JGI-2019a]
MKHLSLIDALFRHGDCAVYSGGGVKGELSAGECVTGNGPNSICGSVFVTQQRGGLADAVNLGIIMASGISDSVLMPVRQHATRSSYTDSSNPGYLAGSLAWATGGYAPDLQQDAGGAAHCEHHGESNSGGDEGGNGGGGDGGDGGNS